MEQLPDDVLVMTMKKYLGVEDVIGCRLVCKRFAALALHPDVWRGRRIDRRYPHIRAKRYSTTVLHLAPCLEFYSTDMVPALITTRCAISELRLRVAKEGFIAAEYALAVRNQEALGRLKSLHLEYYSQCYSQVTGGDALMSTLALCCGLETLEISSSVPRTLRPVVHGPSSASLKTFKCELIRNSASFVNTILAAHASTLENVDLEVSYQSLFERYNCWNSDDTARLLAGTPKLRWLVSSVLPGLEAVAVAARETLRILGLDFIAKDQPAVTEAARTLRKATKLKNVSLTFRDDDDDDSSRPDFCGEVIEAIASPSIDYLLLRGCPPMEALARKLPGLPALSLLVVCTPLDDELDKLLLAITPHAAPALRTLQLESHDDNYCTHAWMHRDAVSTVLTANPLLHIQVKYTTMCEEDVCPACSLGCHKDDDETAENWELGVHLQLFSHDHDKCPAPEKHETHGMQIQIRTS
ncbi:uncharacterized protein LOC113207699 [Frankliniella occidentalis]|uniref:Uncharacterized protein LOC113207699 n=1 Tax=Frankliniella occidentalis TaxID=133901 RepID=A0A6J1SFY7_FRAOC|nr:uncharacterized protein LOC113207699 [Frankliniella occidentalis]